MSGFAPSGWWPTGWVQGATAPSSGNVTLDPAAGTATGAGESPTVSASADLAAGTGAAAGSGQQPSVSAGADVSPAGGDAAAAGQSPSVTVGTDLSPAAGDAAGAGGQPAVTEGADLSPAAATAIGTGETPSVTVGAELAAGAGGAEGAGEQPSISVGGGETAGGGQATGTGESPSVTAGADLSPGAGGGAGAGGQPTVAAGTELAPGSGSASGAGAAPTVTAAPSTGTSVSPGSGAATGAGGSPTVTEGISLAPGVGAAAGAGSAPAVAAPPRATINSEIQKLAPSAVIEMFVLDMGPVGGPVVYYHGGTNGLMQPVVWQGNTYAAVPVQAEGFEWNGRGLLPRPKIQIANVLGTITALLLTYGDLVGCKVTRKRTLAKFLDAANFASGTNPTADPTAEFPDDIFYIEQRTVENRNLVEFQLAAAFDFEGMELPRRAIVQNVCSWIYRSAECGYTGTAYFDTNDNPVGSAAQDVCGKRLSSCQVRFGANNPLPYGGFPAAGLTRA